MPKSKLGLLPIFGLCWLCAAASVPHYDTLPNTVKRLPSQFLSALLPLSQAHASAAKATTKKTVPKTQSSPRPSSASGLSSAVYDDSCGFEQIRASLFAQNTKANSSNHQRTIRAFNLVKCLYKNAFAELGMPPTEIESLLGPDALSLIIRPLNQVFVPRYDSVQEAVFSPDLYGFTFRNGKIQTYLSGARCLYTGQEPGPSGGCGPQIESDSPQALSTGLFRTVVLVIFAHEIAHHIHAKFSCDKIHGAPGGASPDLPPVDDFWAEKDAIRVELSMLRHVAGLFEARGAALGQHMWSFYEKIALGNFYAACQSWVQQPNADRLRQTVCRNFTESRSTSLQFMETLDSPEQLSLCATFEPSGNIPPPPTMNSYTILRLFFLDKSKAGNAEDFKTVLADLAACAREHRNPRTMPTARAHLQVGCGSP